MTPADLQLAVDALVRNIAIGFLPPCAKAETEISWSVKMDV